MSIIIKQKGERVLLIEINVLRGCGLALFCRMQAKRPVSVSAQASALPIYGTLGGRSGSIKSFSTAVQRYVPCRFLLRRSDGFLSSAPREDTVRPYADVHSMN